MRDACGLIPSIKLQMLGLVLSAVDYSRGLG